MRAQDKGARILALPPSLGCFGAGARGPGSLGLAPVVATASFPLINLPKFYLSFTILVSLILVKYPDRVGLVNTVRYQLVPRYKLVPPRGKSGGEPFQSLSARVKLRRAERFFQSGHSRRGSTDNRLLW